ncbi:luciferase-like domain-containing protein [Dactylonectria macrodidyma]|uniref:Luciferase-like domain-containing protein n=1 Tax=Dactylonectria macrodidyma TaxID=307937 RepID=A0A9P9EM04_9HYPO|nr:luciferase-like domain-containing protein [Dactylonectria macrodidyma]
MVQPSTQDKKCIYLNAFDACTVGHTSPGQWRNPIDRSAEKRDLNYWLETAKLLEKGKFLSYFLADTVGGFDVYKGSRDAAIKIGSEFPVTDPFVPISAMAAVTTSLGFGVTASTSYERPFLLARRFSTLDHFTKGRIAWNVVTSWNKASALAMGLTDILPHDERYEAADELMVLLYKLWESSIADDAVVKDKDSETYIDPSKVRTIKHRGKYHQVESPFIVDPSPQRTPFLFQAGTSPAGSAFAAKHAEAIFVAGHVPGTLAPKIANIRRLAAEQGRDPQSLKFFQCLTVILGETDEDAKKKLEVVKKYQSIEGGLVIFSVFTGIDLSEYDLDQEIKSEDSKSSSIIQSAFSNLFNEKQGTGKWTPRRAAQELSIDGNGAVLVGSPQTVADGMERWVREADVDGFNLSPVVQPQSWEDIVELLVPELQRRGIYWEDYEAPGGTLRENVQGKGSSRLRDDHVGHTYAYSLLNGN